MPSILARARAAARSTARTVAARVSSARDGRPFSGRKTELGEPRLVVAEGSEQNGLVMMLHQLLQQNLEDHPHKKRDLFRLLGRVAIVVEDAGVALTLEFASGTLTFHDGVVGIPDLTIRAESENIMQMSLIELVPRLGLPDLRKEHAKAAMRAQKEGRVQMFGTLANIPLVVRLTRLMSVNP